jgi:hypothetical protein
MQIRLTSLLYKLSKLWRCERACKREPGIISSAPAFVSLYSPATQKIITNQLLFLSVVNWGWEYDVWDW